MNYFDKIILLKLTKKTIFYNFFIDTCSKINNSAENSYEKVLILFKIQNVLFILLQSTNTIQYCICLDYLIEYNGQTCILIQAL
jgi:hypothetical protein